MYKIPDSPLDLAKLQDEVLQKWKENSSFKQSITNRDGAEEFVFYDGPPFANGLPHYGHLLTSFIKDTVARFWTMTGNKVERRFGWDCHGLPAEMETEKELHVSGRVDIIKYGIDKFNDACRSSVMKYSKQWEEYIEKAGRWVDFSENYKTMDASYMESVIWGFKQIYEKGLIYEDFRVMPYSWKCETPLSNFETRMDNSYREIKSKALTVKLQLKDAPKKLKHYKCYILIWTTTAWTLPSNLAVAINKTFTYVALKTAEGECSIIEKNLAKKYEKELGSEIVAEFKGEELLNLSYIPLFKYFENTENAFKILHGDFVEAGDGTGAVHMAPGFGEDDWLLCKENKIPIVCPVDDAGKFTSELYPYLEFETTRLRFENITEDDTGLIKDLLKDVKEMKFENANESAHFYINHTKRFGAAPMVIELKETGEKIGIAGIITHDPLKPLVEGNIEVICFLLPKFHDMGYGREAFSFFVKYAFARFKTETILAVIMEGTKNGSSHKMLTEMCGFEYIGVVFDPRAGLNVHKYIRGRIPKSFATLNLTFTKQEGCNYKISHRREENDDSIGTIGINNENLLQFHFVEQEKLPSKLKKEAILEALNVVAFGEVNYNGELIKELKDVGFFDSKIGIKRHSEILYLQGKQVLSTSEDIAIFLKYQGALVKQEQYSHNYPHCWRTDTPLIYKAVPSWYVEVSKIKNRMVELNKQINWIPLHIRDGQFGKWLENARDWSITRNRFWGSPVPVWKVFKNGVEEKEVMLEFKSLTAVIDLIKSLHLQQSAVPERFTKNEFWNIKIVSGKNTIFFPTLVKALNFNGFEEEGEGVYTVSYKRNYVFGSKKELEEFFDVNVKDFHRPFIDDLKIQDPYIAGAEIMRVSDVLDCWFESGSMPFASVHFPFKHEEWFHSHNPSDFICEYVAQTRGWFYTLMVLSTAIFDRIPFKTALCHGVILDSNGQKLSKRLRNYPDPIEVFNTQGSDAMRWFLLSSPVVLGGDLNISKDGAEIRDVVRLVINPIWSAYKFFAMYANADKIKAEISFSSENLMDKYILSKLSILQYEVKEELAKYYFPAACRKIEEFIDVLNNWYIRRNKERFWKDVKDEDKTLAYNTLYSVLVEFIKVVAPLLPFTSESIYQYLINYQNS